MKTQTEPGVDSIKQQGGLNFRVSYGKTDLDWNGLATAQLFFQSGALYMMNLWGKSYPLVGYDFSFMSMMILTGGHSPTGSGLVQGIGVHVTAQFPGVGAPAYWQGNDTELLLNRGLKDAKNSSWSFMLVGNLPPTDDSSIRDNLMIQMLGSITRVEASQDFGSLGHLSAPSLAS